MLWTIFVVLVISWLLGFSLHVGGSLIHLLLVVGLVVLVINLLSGRRSAVRRKVVRVPAPGGPGVASWRLLRPASGSPSSRTTIPSRSL